MSSNNNFSSKSSPNPRSQFGAMMMKQKSSIAERLQIGEEVHELKFGCTFNPKNTTNAFHTIKYDFKPASVDKNRVATVEVGSNNQVTVTVPNLESSGVPHTIYKGNQKKYTKECILIIDKETGDITLEKLSHNIQVKKTREMTNKPNVPSPSLSSGPPSMKLENNTMRVTSKTKVSTGNRKNNIIELKTRNSPLQRSPSTMINSRSPPTAPPWNGITNQLPNVCMDIDEYDDPNVNQLQNHNFNNNNNNSNMKRGNNGNMGNVQLNNSSPANSHSKLDSASGTMLSGGATSSVNAIGTPQGRQMGVKPKQRQPQGKRQSNGGIQNNTNNNINNTYNNSNGNGIGKHQPHKQLQKQQPLAKKSSPKHYHHQQQQQQQQQHQHQQQQQQQKHQHMQQQQEQKQQQQTTIPPNEMDMQMQIELWQRQLQEQQKLQQEQEDEEEDEQLPVANHYNNKSNYQNSSHLSPLATSPPSTNGYMESKKNTSGASENSRNNHISNMNNGTMDLDDDDDDDEEEEDDEDDDDDDEDDDDDVSMEDGSKRRRSEMVPSPTLAHEAAALEMNIVNELSLSSSSSDSDSSDSDSDDDDDSSDDDEEEQQHGAEGQNNRGAAATAINTNGNHGQAMPLDPHSMPQQINPLLNLGRSLSAPSSPEYSATAASPPSSVNLLHHHNNNNNHQGANQSESFGMLNGAYSADLLHNDLQLSSNSSDDDDDDDEEEGDDDEDDDEEDDDEDDDDDEEDDE